MNNLRAVYLVEIPYSLHNLSSFISLRSNPDHYFHRASVDFFISPPSDTPHGERMIVVRFDNPECLSELEKGMQQLQSSLEDKGEENSRTSKMSANLRSR